MIISFLKVLKILERFQVCFSSWLKRMMQNISLVAPLSGLDGVKKTGAETELVKTILLQESCLHTLI